MRGTQYPAFRLRAPTTHFNRITLTGIPVTRSKRSEGVTARNSDIIHRITDCYFLLFCFFEDSSGRMRGTQYPAFRLRAPTTHFNRITLTGIPVIRSKRSEGVTARNSDIIRRITDCYFCCPVLDSQASHLYGHTNAAYQGNAP